MDAVSKAAIQLSVFRNSDRARVVAREACMQLKELQNIREIFQWEDKCACMGQSPAYANFVLSALYVRTYV